MPCETKTNGARKIFFERPNGLNSPDNKSRPVYLKKLRAMISVCRMTAGLFQTSSMFKIQTASRNVRASSSGVNPIGFAFMLLAFAALVTISAMCSSRMP